MGKSRKRQREIYEVVGWSPVLAVLNDGSSQVEVRTAVVSGQVTQWQIDDDDPRRSRLIVGDKVHVHGHWLPARCVLQSSQFRFVVDVDLVRHSTPQQTERDLQQVADAAAANNLRSLARPVAWTRLLVEPDGNRVLHASQHTDRHSLRVTQVTVLPLLQRVGRRGQHAIDRSVLVAPGELLRVVLEQVQLHGVLSPAPRSRRSDVGVLQARELPVRRGRAPERRMTVTRALLVQVRDVHQAAPQGSKTLAVMQALDCGKRKAQWLIRQSQLQLQWGLAHERSKQSRPQHKQRGK